MMDRRTFIAATAIPTLMAGQGRATPQSEIQRLFADWPAHTGEYLRYNQKWAMGTLSGDDFEVIADPILNFAGAVADSLFALECQSLADLLCKVRVATYFDWTIEAYNEGVGRCAERLAG